MKVITIKEYEKINAETLKTKSSNYKYDFNELLDFIKDFASSASCEDAYTFMSVGRNREGDYVSFKNYVGIIQLKSGLQIEILPKIDFSDDKDNQKLKTVFINMLKTLKTFKGKSFNMAHLNINKMTFYEIFINMYLSELLMLVKRGLHSNYIFVENNLNVLKGKISIKDQIRKNYINKEKFYVKYDDYQLNKPINRIIKSTLLKLQLASIDNNNKKMAHRLLTHFELVEPSTNYENDFKKIIFNRTNRDYEWIIEWSKVFLKNNSFTNFSGLSKSKALLFPMDILFESFIAKHIKDNFSNAFDVSVQDSNYHLLNFGKDEKFAIRPDLVLRNDKQIVILDTKWKVLSETKKNFGIDQSDMYQMYAYYKKYFDAEVNLSEDSKPKLEVWMLYPMNREMINYEKDIVFLIHLV